MRLKKVFAWSLNKFIFLGILLSTHPVFSQISGLSGLVSTENNNPLQGCNIYLKTLKLTENTDAQGRFSFAINPIFKNDFNRSHKFSSLRHGFINLNLVNKGFIKVTLYNSRGHLLNKPWKKNFQPGNHQISLTELHNTQLSNGLYFLKIEYKNQFEIHNLFQTKSGNKINSTLILENKSQPLLKFSNKALDTLEISCANHPKKLIPIDNYSQDLGNLSLLNRPNIVIIYIDDMGWKDVGATGSEYYQTPNIDKLAADGMILARSHSSSPVCSPSRGAILSGKNPARTKFTTVWGTNAMDTVDTLYTKSKYNPKVGEMTIEAKHRHMMSISEVTFAEAMRDAGYMTGMVGKWHCGYHEEAHPDNQGFTYAEGFRNRPSSTRGHFGEDWIGWVKGLENLQPQDDMADVLTEKAVQFFQTYKDTSFIFYLSHYAVHGPLEAQPAIVQKYQNLPTTDQNNPVYAAMVESTDRSVGNVVQALRDLGLEENTVIIYTSDNGGPVPNSTSNLPLLGGKSFPYEAGTRVPFIIKWPAGIPKGTIDSTRNIQMDFYPTFLEMAGVPLRPQQHADGISLLPLITQTGPLPYRPLFFHYPHYTHATGPESNIIDGDWKLIRFYNTANGEFQLFNLKEDPEEMNDVTNLYPAKVAELKGKIEAYLLESGAEMPYPNPIYDGVNPIKDKKASYNLARNVRQTLLDR